MIAIDTNILVYAHVPGIAQHRLALGALETLVGSGANWAVPWPCAHEFCAVITNRKWRGDAVDAATAIDILRTWENAPNFRFLGTTHLHLNCFAQTLALSGVTGGQVHDARIAATCIEHNVAELWTADRDFSRFPGLRTRNPLVSAGKIGR
jgi:toxin-antitoxin system PIN domain toxin